MKACVAADFMVFKISCMTSFLNKHYLNINLSIMFYLLFYFCLTFVI
jgi:hypothetical protein